MGITIYLFALGLHKKNKWNEMVGIAYFSCYCHEKKDIF